MKEILITGGAGFIGTHLTAMAHAAGHQIRILDNLSPQIHGEKPEFQPPAGVEFIRGDITKRGDIERSLAGIDTIVHLAAETGTGQSMYEIERYYGVNVQGTALLFDVLANAPNVVRKIVLASSRSVYGEGAYQCSVCGPGSGRCYPRPRLPDQLAAHQWEPRCPNCGGFVQAVATRESDAVAPASVYAASKLAQEHLVSVCCGSLGLGSAILRFQNVFGEGQSLKNPYTGILSIFSTRIRLGLSLPIFEDGRETRDFVHVEDVAGAVMNCVENDHMREGVVNVGMGQATSIEDVARLLCRIMNSSIQPEVTGQYRVGDIRHNFADIGQLVASGFRPRISLDEGMRRFCEWVMTQPVPADLLEKANQELKARNLMS